MGEFGWPNNYPQDQERYNLLGETYLRDMRAAGLRGSQWATGEWWGSAYRLSVYARTASGRPVDTMRPQAPVLERHTDIAGIQVNGGEFGAPSGITALSVFSNANPGRYDIDWHYDSQATFSYLASRGLREVTIPFRWERIQPAPGGGLDPAELGRLEAAIGRARGAGLEAVPMVANYGAYWLHDPLTGSGIRRPIGGAQITIAHFADLWRRLSAALDDESGIAAYGLMREPIGQPGGSIRDQAKVWEAASQAAVNAIRANGDDELLLVPGYRYSNTHNWPTQHPSSWVKDPLNNYLYEAHHYWDAQHSGDYQSYDL
ncbi:MAG TPA: cellulase family glycosylhydrolase, partial [Thermomicrobiales bacterium]|nr:cellulase family glycosylhydrolase [Thermomicrobiales bacterium]